MGNKVATAPDKKEEKEERGEWGSPMEFILSCLGYAVGLGNVWRFPYIVYTNGGGAFLIPYVLMLTLCGLPTFFIELSVGQYSAANPLSVWEAAPLFQGVGVGMLLVTFIGSIYYNMIIAWSLYYMFASFQKVLPWQDCTHTDYNTENCYSKREAEDCEAKINETTGEIYTWYNQTCHEGNLTMKKVSPSEEYFNYKMLDISPSIGEPGYLKWDLVLTLLLAWIIVWLCVIKGIRSSGKVVYFTATFPYLLLVILFFRAVTLPGALDGIKWYIIPEWEHLAKPKVWADAAGQIFFSLSVGFGGLMTFASYNKFHNNVYRDTMIVTIGNCVTSFFAGFVIFSILGFMAKELDVPIKDVASSGSGLAFIAYPEVVTRLQPPQLWAVIFFFMLLTLGLDSQFAGIENIQTMIIDQFPRLRRRKMFVSLGICLVMFVMGLSMCTRAGVYWLELMSYYSSGWSLILIATAEAMIFAWVYGAKRLMGNIKEMVGFKLNMHWWACWMFITPTLLVAILIFNFWEFTPLAYGDYVLEGWVQGLGWAMAVGCVVFIPIVAVIKVIREYLKTHQSIPVIIKKLCQSTDKWGPTPERLNRGKDVEESPQEIEKHTNGSVAEEKAEGFPNSNMPQFGQSNPAYSSELDSSAPVNTTDTRL